MIVFGWNTYALKTLSPEELGTTGETPNVRLQYRQKYFHLFFIPCIPIGRQWVVNQDGKYYHPSPELKAALPPVKVGRVGLWAWSGPLLLLAGWLLYGISNDISEKQYREQRIEQQALLSGFFKQPGNTEPLRQKLQSINSLLDSSLGKGFAEPMEMDTTEEKLMGNFMQAQFTQTDSLTGYTPDNTLVVLRCKGAGEPLPILSKEVQAALQTGAWQSGYDDTSSVYSNLRKLKGYEHVLLLTEYSRAEPMVDGDGYKSGYSLLDAKLINVTDHKVEKRFELMAHNSDRISAMTFNRSNYVSPSEWRQRLTGDLKQNMLKEAYSYVFHKKDLY